MSEFGQAEGEPLTLDEWKEAVKAAGWRVVFVAKDAAIVPRLLPANAKRQVRGHRVARAGRDGFRWGS